MGPITSGLKLVAVALLLSLIPDAASATPMRMMPLGDSITRGPSAPSGWDRRSSGGYRGLLKQKLVDAAVDVDMVGSQSHGDFGDTQHEGHGGFRIDQLADGVNSWLAANPPDIVLLMAGTNGVRWKHDDPADYAAELDDLVGQIFSQMAGDVHISVASIPPMLANDQHRRNNWKVEVYNSYLPGIVEKYRDAGQSISFVDVHASLTPDTDIWTDGVHPRRAGFEKIADAFFTDITSIVPEPQAVALIAMGMLILNATTRRLQSR